MSTDRKKLSLRMPAAPEEREDRNRTILQQAMERRVCVRWTYNRTLMRAAPHVLYKRHGDLFVDAVVIERNGATPAEMKLGTFKLAGLSSLALTEEPLVLMPALVVDDGRYLEEVVGRA